MFQKENHRSGRIASVKKPIFPLNSSFNTKQHKVNMRTTPKRNVKPIYANYSPTQNVKE